MNYSADQYLMELADQGYSLDQAEALVALGRPFAIHEIISSGVDLDESQFVEGLIYGGHNHHLFGPPASGKSWVSLYIAKRVMEQGGVVHYFDWENGVKVFARRVQSMGIPLDLVENNLFYRFNPTLTNFRLLIRALAPRPHLIIFDSLSAALNKDLVGENAENSNQQVLTWLTNHFDPLSARGISSLSIDHTGHDGGRPRGASVKSFYMDVQISQTSEGFNRREAGIVNLHVEKDRHGYFDNDVSVLLGGTPFSFEIKPKDEIKPKGKKEKKVDPILSYLKENGPATNREISEGTETNLKTIKNQTGRLFSKEIIREVGTSDDGQRIYGLA